MAGTTIRAYDVASMFLRAIHAPDTTPMRRAVAIWLRFESGGTITGNNPWNQHSGPACAPHAAAGGMSNYCPGAGNLPGQIGNRYAGPGDKNVAVFDTLQHGVTANANNLVRLAPAYGYGAVLAQARAGNGLGFLIALQNSGWSAGHYGHSKLASAFRSALNYNTVMRISAVGGGASDPTPDPKPGKTVSFPFRSIVEKFSNVTGATTFSDAMATTYAVVILDVPEFVKLIVGGDGNTLLEGEAWNRARDRVALTAKAYSGKPVSSLPDTLSVPFTADETTPSPAQGPLDALAASLGGIATAIGGIGNIFAFLLDGENWLYILALGGGVVLAGVGFSQLTGARIPRPGIEVGV